MQGKRLIKLGDQEYTIEEAFGGEYAVYIQESLTIPADTHVAGKDLEPGTLVVIVARVAGPSPEVELERRNYRQVHWSPVSAPEARRALRREYRETAQSAWRSLATGSVVGAGQCQYRKREGHG